VNELKIIFDTLTVGGVGVWTGVMMFAFYLMREWRETRKLSDADKLARRDGYAKQVETLQKENRELRGDVDKLEKKHTEYREWCEAQHDNDRKMVRALEDKITGLIRTLSAGQLAALETLPLEIVPTAVKAASDRVGEILRDQYGVGDA